MLLLLHSFVCCATPFCSCRASGDVRTTAEDTLIYSAPVYVGQNRTVNITSGAALLMLSCFLSPHHPAAEGRSGYYMHTCGQPLLLNDLDLELQGGEHSGCSTLETWPRSFICGPTAHCASRTSGCKVCLSKQPPASDLPWPCAAWQTHGCTVSKHTALRKTGPGVPWAYMEEGHDFASTCVYMRTLVC